MRTIIQGKPGYCIKLLKDIPVFGSPVEGVDFEYVPQSVDRRCSDSTSAEGGGMSDTWTKTGKELLDRLGTQKQAITEQAVNAMVAHYRCSPGDLTLHRTSRFPSEILTYKTPGLAYLIQLIISENDGFWRAEPIYLDVEDTARSNLYEKKEVGITSEKKVRA